jgi:aerobic-type carbon monoxide dehydrogenase small subunit (CoxS/CutS family)
MTIAFAVNGAPHQVDASRGEDLLIDYLHEDLNLTGAKLCCGIAVCRACTVAMTKPPNEAATPIVACSTSLQMIDGAEITTIEGVTPANGSLLPIQQAFLSEFAFQCGYCAPGFVIASHIFLERLNRAPISRSQLDNAIAEAIGAHICRCTGYVRYHAALRKTAEALLEGRG